MNKYLKFLILLPICILLTGCWNYRELNSIYIVAGVAVDRDLESGLFEVSIEAINMKDTDVEPNIESYRFETMGEALFDAIREMIKFSSKKLYWSHTTTLIISQDLARESILPTLDWIARDQEPRLAIDVFISKEETAREILETQSLATDIRSFELDVMVNQSENFIEIPLVRVYQLINQLSKPKTHPVIPTVKTNIVHGKKTNELSGAAVFNKDRLVGFLNDEDVKAYLFITDKIKGGLLNVTNNEKPNGHVVLEIFKSKTKLKPIVTKDSISFDIETFTDVSIGELNTLVDYISKPGRDELKKLAEDTLKSDIERVINEVRKEYGVDIFGFGDIIRQRNPRLWKEIEAEWDTIFMDLDFNIKPQVHIRNSGHFSKPIEVVK